MTYTTNFCLNYDRIIDRNYQTANEAIKACKNFIKNCGVNDFGGCYITDEWADMIYECTKGGIETYFVKFKGYLYEVSEKTFNTVYSVK